MIMPGALAHSASTFYFRILVFLATPILYVYLSPLNAVETVTGLLAIGFAVDFFLGKTAWFAIRPIPLFTMLAYTGFAAIHLLLYGQFSLSAVLCTLLLLSALSSDMIVNSSRWKILAPAGILSMLIVSAILGDIPTLKAPNIFPPIAFVAAVVRLSFPRTKHLIHTSLDYRLARLEILSLGMQKAVAMGIRKISR